MAGRRRRKVGALFSRSSHAHRAIITHQHKPFYAVRFAHRPFYAVRFAHRHRAEIEQLKKKFESVESADEEEKENDENVVNFGTPVSAPATALAPAAAPDPDLDPAPAPTLNWLTQLETDPTATTSPSNSYNPSIYQPPNNEESYASFSSNVLTGSVAHDPLNSSLNELSALGNSIRSPSRSSAVANLPTVVDTSPVQSPTKARRAMQPLLSESLLSTEGKLLKSMNDPLDMYGLRAYELLKQQAIKKEAPAHTVETPASPMAKSLADFRNFTKQLDNQQTQFNADVSIDIDPPVEAPVPSFDYAIGGNNDVRDSYTPNKSSAMADYMMAKHMVETKAAERQLQQEGELRASGADSPFREAYSPTKASMMAEYKVARDVVEMNADAEVTFEEDEEEEEYEPLQTFITAPASPAAALPSRVSPTRDSYSPSKASAMAEYKVAKQAVESAPKVDVSDSDIEALKAEMQDLRSQLSGVTSAVVTVAKELTGVRNVTQSLPSPPIQDHDFQYENEEDEEEEEEEGNSDEGGEGGFLIQQALEREMADGMMRMSQEKSVTASGGSLRSTLPSSLRASREDAAIPPPPPTPPPTNALEDVMGSIPNFDFKRSSLDMAAATRDLEEWGGDQSEGFAVKVTGLDLTIKNVRFPDALNESVSEALNLPSPPRRGIVKMEDGGVTTKVRTIEEKVKAVMNQAKRGGGVGKALGLSMDERGWKEGIIRGGRARQSVDKSMTMDDAMNDTMDNTLFSPEAKTAQEKEAKVLRRGMRKEERDARGEREKRAMEERRQAFNAVFGKGATEAEAKAAGLTIEGVTKGGRGGGFDVLLPPQPPVQTSNVRQSREKARERAEKALREKEMGKERAPLFPEDDEEDFDPACLTLDNFVSTNLGLDVMAPSSTAGSSRMMELQAQLPGSTFRGGVIKMVEPPRVPTPVVGSPSAGSHRGYKGGGLVMEMSPGFGGAKGGKGKRGEMFSKFRERKMREEEERKRRVEDRVLGGDNSPTKWEPPRQTDDKIKNKGRGVGGGRWRQGPSSTALTGASMVCGGNSKSVRNAISMVCLAGAHVTAERERALQAVELAKGEAGGGGGRMVILLSKGATNLAYRGLYVSSPDGTRAKKVEGWGPRVLEAKSKVLKEFYRFNTGKKTFQELGNRTFGGTVDAVSLDPTELRKRGGA